MIYIKILVGLVLLSGILNISGYLHIPWFVSIGAWLLMLFLVYRMFSKSKSDKDIR